MIDIEKISQSVPSAGTEYMGQDGLLHCSTCGDAVETRITVPWIGERKVRCVCSCITKRDEERREQARREEVDRNRKTCFAGSKMMGCRFEASDQSQQLKMAANYVKQFSHFKAQGKGLLLHGPTGTGKSHIAACVANALLDEGSKCLMTNFATIVNELQSSFEGRQDYINNLNKYTLLILDDLGTERKSEYMQEQVYNIIDARYRSGLPMIITTNLTIEEIKKPSDIGNARIYDRILEKCFPIEVGGQSIRRQNIKKDFGHVQMMLKGD